MLCRLRFAACRAHLRAVDVFAIGVFPLRIQAAQCNGNPAAGQAAGQAADLPQGASVSGIMRRPGYGGARSSI